MHARSHLASPALVKSSQKAKIFFEYLNNYYIPYPIDEIPNNQNFVILANIRSGYNAKEILYGHVEWNLTICRFYILQT